jgi:hypothetical protein
MAGRKPAADLELFCSKARKKNNQIQVSIAQILKNARARFIISSSRPVLSWPPTRCNHRILRWRYGI